MVVSSPQLGHILQSLMTPDLILEKDAFSIMHGQSVLTISPCNLDMSQDMRCPIMWFT